MIYIQTGETCMSVFPQNSSLTAV